MEGTLKELPRHPDQRRRQTVVAEGAHDAQIDPAIRFEQLDHIRAMNRGEFEDKFVQRARTELVKVPARRCVRDAGFGSVCSAPGCFDHEGACVANSLIGDRHRSGGIEPPPPGDYS